MAAPSLARSGYENTPSYVDKGRALYLEGFELFRYLGRGRWIVPSATVEGRVYEVDLRSDRCECLGYGSHRHCCHLVAATIASAKTGVCSCCGGRVPNPELYEVAEEDELLSWFAGDMVCRDCCEAGAWA